MYIDFPGEWWFWYLSEIEMDFSSLFNCAAIAIAVLTLVTILYQQKRNEKIVLLEKRLTFLNLLTNFIDITVPDLINLSEKVEELEQEDSLGKGYQFLHKNFYIPRILTFQKEWIQIKSPLNCFIFPKIAHLLKKMNMAFEAKHFKGSEGNRRFPSLAVSIKEDEELLNIITTITDEILRIYIPKL